MTRQYVLYAFLLFTAVGTHAQEASITIEQILSAPFPSEIVAAPVEGKVAWVFNERGARNIWVADSPRDEGRRLTEYTGDDGQEITELQWTSDGKTVVYLRGGAPNGRGEFPNPTSDPIGMDQTIWRVDLAGGEPRKVATGSGPALSPNGRVVAYINKNQIWTIGISGRSQPKQVLKGRGSVGTLRWSPVGDRIAFVSRRGDSSYIGVIDLNETVTWLSPSVDRDGNPAWSPDGKRIAFIRLPTPAPDFAFYPHREGHPWSIRVAEVANGESGEIWCADEGMGSVFRGVVANNQLLWGEGDRIVFPWEKEGWTHLYSVHAGGGVATPLTSGHFEVEHVALSQDKRQVYYSSNEEDIERRHLWRVPVDGGSAIPVTSGTGIEWSPAPLSDGHSVALLRSDSVMPARPAVVTEGGGVRDLAGDSMPGDFPATLMVEPRAVSFEAADGETIRGQLFVRGDWEAGVRRPAMIFFHGGSRRQMLLGWHKSDYYHNAYGMNQYLANHGYVVLAVNYRSGIGYGMEFREALGYGATGASEFSDVLGAGRYLRGRDDVDPARIGLWGGSYGGFLTAMGLAKASDLFAVGVDIHGVHDWNVVIKNFIADYDTLRDPERARVAFESSPMAYVETWRSPVLLIHGDDDRNVPFGETSRLVESLREQGVRFEQLVFPDEVHGFLLHSNWLKAYRAAADFIEGHLGDD